MAPSDPFTALNPATPANAARTDGVGDARGASGDTPDAKRAQMKQLAQEFEAMLMNEMLSGWRNSLLEDEDSEEPGMAGLGQMTDMVGNEFGRALSKSGGLGIAEVLMRSFERQLGTQTASSPGTPETISMPAGSAQATAAPMSGAAAVMRAVASSGSTAGSGAIAAVTRSAMAAFEATSPVDGAVTSGYGWRADPFTGQSRFHAGLDLRMAYGQDVASVAPGTVSFAGEQGGYGLTVVVDHGKGLQTRYAHLSSADVQVGDVVSSGQRLARSGSSGRSTGPHLHVELLSQGKPVDPSGLLKQATGDADWMAYRTPSSRSSD